MSLERARRREGPARAAAALILHLGDDAARAPVDARGQVGRFLLVVARAAEMRSFPGNADGIGGATLLRSHQVAVLELFVGEVLNWLMPALHESGHRHCFAALALERLLKMSPSDQALSGRVLLECERHLERRLRRFAREKEARMLTICAGFACRRA